MSCDKEKKPEGVFTFACKVKTVYMENENLAQSIDIVSREFMDSSVRFEYGKIIIDIVDGYDRFKPFNLTGEALECPDNWIYEIDNNASNQEVVDLLGVAIALSSPNIKYREYKREISCRIHEFRRSINSIREKYSKDLEDPGVKVMIKIKDSGVWEAFPFEDYC